MPSGHVAETLRDFGLARRPAWPRPQAAHGPPGLAWARPPPAIWHRRVVTSPAPGASVHVEAAPEQGQGVEEVVPPFPSVPGELLVFEDMDEN